MMGPHGFTAATPPRWPWLQLHNFKVRSLGPPAGHRDRWQAFAAACAHEGTDAVRRQSATDPVRMCRAQAPAERGGVGGEPPRECDADSIYQTIVCQFVAELAALGRGLFDLLWRT
jgi:hypothetical protein